MYRPTLSVDEELALLSRGAEDIFPEEEFKQKLKQARETGRPLRVKLGIDPTATDLHLGHMIPVLKLKTFQELGHQVVLIVGDYTATVGDPSGQNKSRPQLSHEEVLANARHYEDMVFQVLDKDRTEIVTNGTWFGEMAFSSVIDLMAEMTLARMLEREDFSQRYRSQSPISLHELIYPLMQGYDSVMVESDIELGGTDQKFNILVGRDLQRTRGMEPQVGVCNPLLIGLDGKEKMSKSLDNTIAVNDRPEDMYGKVMSVPDDLMWHYFELITEVPLDEVDQLKSTVQAGSAHPRDVKMRLAREITARFHSADAARKGEEHFARVIGRGEAPEEMPHVVLASEAIVDGAIWIVKLLVEAGLAASNGEARRLVEQGGVRIDGEIIRDPRTDWPVQDGAVLQAGRRRYARVKVG